MRVRALEETNSILSAYLGLLITRCGSVKLPKSLVSRGIGGFDVTVFLEGDHYVIKATPIKEGFEGIMNDITVGEPNEEKEGET